MAKYKVVEKPPPPTGVFAGNMASWGMWDVKCNDVWVLGFYDKNIAEDFCAALNFGAELRKDMELKKELIGLKNNDYRLDKFVPVFCSKCNHNIDPGEMFEINLQTNEKLCPKCWGYKEGTFSKLPKLPRGGFF